MRITIAALVLLALAPAALAADLHVGKRKPYTKIQDAVDAAKGGDRIIVGPGVYREHVRFDGVDNLQFIGRGAVWDGRLTGGASADVLAGTGDGTLVTGFRFRNGVIQVYLHGADVRVTRCTGRGASGEHVVVVGDRATIERCESVGASWSGIRVNGNGADVRSNRIRNGGAAGGAGVYVAGDDANVEGNDLRAIVYNAGITVVGRRATVVRNRAYNADAGGVHVVGDGAVVLRNVCSYAANGSGLYVEGNQAEIGWNRATACVTGIELSGDGTNVHDNVVQMTTGGNGIQLTASNTGAATVERNSVSDTGSWGFAISGGNATLRANRAYRCGRSGSGGFITTNSSEVEMEDCVADSSRRTGFRISANSASLSGCRATNSTGDGFRVYGGAPRLTNLVATGNGGEGLDNRGAGTKVQGCRFLGNRLDVACDAGNGASFDGGLAGATYRTGGPEQTPQVDN
jgi:hypothetical protein